MSDESTPRTPTDSSTVTKKKEKTGKDLRRSTQYPIADLLDRDPKAMARFLISRILRSLIVSVEAGRKLSASQQSFLLRAHRTLVEGEMVELTAKTEVDDEPSTLQQLDMERLMALWETLPSSRN